jgi:F0F1-type ATP synthase assembly protein I
MAKRTTPTVTTFQALAVASQFGITLAICVVLGYFAGHWLDDRLGTGIIFTLIGVLLGLVAAVLNTMRLYAALMRNREDLSSTPNTAQTTPSARTANDGNQLDEESDKLTDTY